jgi:hypothetical protein
MNEVEIQQTLDRTTGFLDRQRLLKQIWKYRRQREAVAVPANASPDRPAPQPVKKTASEPVGSMTA